MRTPIESYELPLVTRGIEHIRVKRGKFLLFDGVMPKGFKMHLMMGDRVLYKLPRQKWRSKFRLTLWRGTPCIKYGKRHKLMPDSARSIKNTMIKGVQ